MLTAGCSTLEQVVYRPDIDRGNYLTANSISDKYSMTQQQVAYTWVTPLISKCNWYEYLVLCLPPATGHEGVTQQTLTLTFNGSGVLTNIDNKPALSGN
ncbi:outer membrane protein assembly factor BamE [Shigella flexneri]